MLKLAKLHKLAFKYLPVAILFVVVLYPKFPFIRIPGSYVSVRFEDLLLAFAAFVWFTYILKNFREFFKVKINKSVVLYVAVGLISLISAILLTKTVDPLIGILHWARRIEYFIPLFIGFTAITLNKKNLDYYLTALVVLIFLVFIYGLGQKYLEWPMIVTQNIEYAKGLALRWAEGGHLNSTFAGHYDLATFMVMVLPIVASLFFVLKNKGWKLTLLAAFMCGLWLLVVSASRMSLVSYLISTSTALILIKRYKYIPVLVVLSLVFIFFSSNLQARFQTLYDVTLQKTRDVIMMNVITVYAEQPQPENLRQRNTPTPAPIPIIEDRSTSIRLNVEWPRAIRAFNKNPLLGTGYSSITLATDNGYLRALGETGLIGFLAFALIFINIIIAIVKLMPFDKKLKGSELAFVAGMTGALPGVLANAVFIDVFEASKFAISFWLFIGMLVGLAVVNNKKWEN